MKNLLKLIGDAKINVKDKLFEEYVDNAISKSNEILEDVRDTVTKSREYCGG